MSNITAPDLLRAFVDALDAALKSPSANAASAQPAVVRFNELLRDEREDYFGPATEGQPISVEEHAFIDKIIALFGGHHVTELPGKPEVLPASDSSSSSSALTLPETDPVAELPSSSSLSSEFSFVPASEESAPSSSSLESSSSSASV